MQKTCYATNKEGLLQQWNTLLARETQSSSLSSLIAASILGKRKEPDTSRASNLNIHSVYFSQNPSIADETCQLLFKLACKNTIEGSISYNSDIAIPMATFFRYHSIQIDKLEEKKYLISQIINPSLKNYFKKIIKNLESILNRNNHSDQHTLSYLLKILQKEERKYLNLLPKNGRETRLLSIQHQKTFLLSLKKNAWLKRCLYAQKIITELSVLLSNCKESQPKEIILELYAKAHSLEQQVIDNKITLIVLASFLNQSTESFSRLLVLHGLSPEESAWNPESTIRRKNTSIESTSILKLYKRPAVCLTLSLSQEEITVQEITKINPLITDKIFKEIQLQKNQVTTDCSLGNAKQQNTDQETVKSPNEISPSRSKIVTTEKFTATDRKSLLTQWSALLSEGQKLSSPSFASQTRKIFFLIQKSAYFCTNPDQELLKSKEFLLKFRGKFRGSPRSHNKDIAIPILALSEYYKDKIDYLEKKREKELQKISPYFSEHLTNLIDELTGEVDSKDQNDADKTIINSLIEKVKQNATEHFALMTETIGESSYVCQIGIKNLSELLQADKSISKNPHTQKIIDELANLRAIWEKTPLELYTPVYCVEQKIIEAKTIQIFLAVLLCQPTTLLSHLLNTDGLFVEKSLWNLRNSVHKQPISLESAAIHHGCGKDPIYISLDLTKKKITQKEIIEEPQLVFDKLFKEIELQNRSAEFSQTTDR